MALKGRDIISIKDLSREEIEEVLKVAHRMIPIAEGSKIDRRLDGVLLALAFLEPSTRTRLSFETAAQRLGGRCITIADPTTSSVAKGEIALGHRPDAFWLRGRDRPSGTRMRVRPGWRLRCRTRPVINAGDGGRPTPDPDATGPRHDPGGARHAEWAQGGAAGRPEVWSHGPFVGACPRAVRRRDRPALAPVAETAGRGDRTPRPDGGEGARGGASSTGRSATPTCST